MKPLISPTVPPLVHEHVSMGRPLPTPEDLHAIPFPPVDNPLLFKYAPPARGSQGGVCPSPSPTMRFHYFSYAYTANRSRLERFCPALPNACLLWERATYHWAYSFLMSAPLHLQHPSEIMSSLFDRSLSGPGPSLSSSLPDHLLSPLRLIPFISPHPLPLPFS